MNFSLNFEYLEDIVVSNNHDRDSSCLALSLYSVDDL